VGAAMVMAVSPLRRGREFSVRIFGSVAGDMTITSMGSFSDTRNIEAREPKMSAAKKAKCMLNTAISVKYLGSRHLLESSMFTVDSCEMLDIGSWTRDA
jgi:hypothetical protein